MFILKFFSTLLTAIKPFFIGALLAYIIAVPCNKLEYRFKKKFSDGIANLLAVLITELIICLLLVFAFVLVIPQCFNSITKIISNGPIYINALQTVFDNFVRKHSVLRMFGLETFRIDDSVVTLITEALMTDANNLISSIYNGVSFVGGKILTAVLSFFISIFIVYERHKVGTRLKEIVLVLLPRKAIMFNNATERLNVVFRQFVVGKTLDSLIVWLICLVILSIMKVPYVLFNSTFIGVTNMVPIIGPIIGAIPCAIIILAESPIKALEFLIVILIIQQIDGHYIGPKCIGRTIGLHTFWVLFAVIVFGKLFGVWGMFFGVPMFAFIYESFNSWIDKRLNKNKDKVVEKIEIE